MEEKITAALEKLGPNAPRVSDTGDTIVLTYDAAGYGKRVSRDFDAIAKLARVVSSSSREVFGGVPGRPAGPNAVPSSVVVTLVVKPLPSNASK